MIDIKWIEKNPEKFDEAMESRGEPYRAKPLLLLYEYEKLGEQIKQLENESKREKAELFVKLKKGGFETEEIKKFIDSLGK